MDDSYTARHPVATIFNGTITITIALVAVAAGLEANETDTISSSQFEAFDVLTLLIFTLELGLKVTVSTVQE